MGFHTRIIGLHHRFDDIFHWVTFPLLFLFSSIHPGPSSIISHESPFSVYTIPIKMAWRDRHPQNVQTMSSSACYARKSLPWELPRPSWRVQKDHENVFIIHNSNRHDQNRHIKPTQYSISPLPSIGTKLKWYKNNKGWRVSQPPLQKYWPFILLI